MERTNLAGAVLRCASFEKADMKEAKLPRCALDRAVFTAAELESVDLSSAVRLRASPHGSIGPWTDGEPSWEKHDNNVNWFRMLHATFYHLRYTLLHLF